MVDDLSTKQTQDNNPGRKNMYTTYSGKRDLKGLPTHLIGFDLCKPLTKQ